VSSEALWYDAGGKENKVSLDLASHRSHSRGQYLQNSPNGDICYLSFY
jgi:hypothetical protein